MYKVIEYWNRHEWTGKIRRTRVYASRATFDRYGRRYIGPTWNGLFLGKAFRLVQINPPVWEEMKDEH